MNSLNYEGVNSLAARWAEVMWAISWQFCVLGLVVLLVHWSLHKAAPNWRYWLWQILAIKLLLMPFWTSAMPWRPMAFAQPVNAQTTLTSVPTSSNLAPVTISSKPTAPTAAVSSNPVPALASDRRRTHEPLRKIPGIQNPAAVAEPKSPARPAKVANSQSGKPRKDRSVAESKPKLAMAGTSPLPDQRIDAMPGSEPGIKRESPLIGDAAVSPALSARVTTPGTMPVQAQHLSWQTWLMLAWIAGVSWGTIRIVYHGMRLSRRLLKTDPADSTLILRVRDAATKLGMTSVPETRVIDMDVSPFVCGLWKPRLIVPRGLTQTFTSEQLDLVLLHELAHVRRRDLVLGWIPELGKLLFFFHPVVHFLYSQIRFERELACDQLAMQSSGHDAATYADTLVRVVGQFSGSDSLQLAAVETSRAQ